MIPFRFRGFVFPFYYMHEQGECISIVEDEFQDCVAIISRPQVISSHTECAPYNPPVSLSLDSPLYTKGPFCFVRIYFSIQLYARAGRVHFNRRRRISRLRSNHFKTAGHFIAHAVCPSFHRTRSVPLTSFLPALHLLRLKIQSDREL